MADTLTDELAEALQKILSAYDPEWPGAAFDLDPGCIECTMGATPNKYNTGLCARHKAERILARYDAEKSRTPMTLTPTEREAAEKMAEALTIAKIFVASNEFASNQVELALAAWEAAQRPNPEQSEAKE